MRGSLHGITVNGEVVRVNTDPRLIEFARKMRIGVHTNTVGRASLLVTVTCVRQQNTSHHAVIMSTKMDYSVVRKVRIADIIRALIWSNKKPSIVTSMRPCPTARSMSARRY